MCTAFHSICPQPKDCWFLTALRFIPSSFKNNAISKKMTNESNRTTN